MISRTLLATALSLAFAAGAIAQTPTPPVAPATTAVTTTQRDVNQQTRIVNGLKDGSLSTREAAKLEGQEARVDRLQAKDLKDGRLSVAERAELTAAQNKLSQNITAERHNGVTGNPESASSRRMQADVARNVAQEKRINAGVQSGSLTKHEAAKLERGQAVVASKEAAAASNGHVGGAEQRSIQRSQHHQSKRIHREKTDAQTRS
ncbi:hypothetical protein BH11PSE10_BH11PSE10_21220 [soil metagenome]